MTRTRPSTSKRPVAAVVLASFVFTAVFGLSFLLGASPALAVGGVVTDPGATAAQSVGTAANVTQTPLQANTSGQTTSQNVTVQKDSILKQIEKAVLPVAMIAIVNAMDFFMKKLAYDAATALATAGTGQKPLFVTEGFGNYLKNTALDAAGEAIGTISQEGGFEKLGIDLCSPRLPKVALNIKLGFINDLKKELGPISARQPAPKCSWKSIEGNWEQFANQGSDDVLNQVGVMFTPGESGVGAAIEFNRYSINLIDKKKDEAKNKYVSNAGFKDLTTKITGQTKTPADSIRAHMSQTQARTGEKTNQETASYSRGLKEAGYAILTNAVKTFAGTLVEKLANRLFDGGLFTLGQLAGGEKDRDLLTNPEASPAGQDRPSAELANKDLLTPRVLSITNYDQLIEFSTCPPEGRNTSNCVMDTQLFSGISRAEQDAPLTVRQAVEQGFLQGGWRMVPLSHPKNKDKNCYQEAYCFSNLAKMRGARILPIGWELAANSPHNDVNNPITLKEAMDRFNDCPRNDEGMIDADKLPDPLHPWCRLIDPNWVLKYPKEICKLQAFGPYPVSSQSSGRSKVCVDKASCIFSDADGNCIGGYGYCTREKGFWKFAADTCPAQYASCQAFKQTGGPTLGYLMNTADSGVCSPDNAGCLRYSTVKSAVPNGGFEDVIGGKARGWNYNPATVTLDRTTRKSFRGPNALGLPSGTTVTSVAQSVLPDSEYSFSGSALADASPAAPYDTEFRLTFRKRDGSEIAAAGLEGDCQKTGNSAFFRIPTTELGFTTQGCKVKSPADAVTAYVSVIGAGGVKTWVDEIGVNGTSYSGDPLDGVFLNGRAKACPDDQAGCSALMRASSGTLNLVRNPGFEESIQGGPLASFWNAPPGSTNGSAFEGIRGFVLTVADLSQDVGGLLGDASYVFSVHSKQEGIGSAPTASAVLEIRRADGSISEIADCDPLSAATALSLTADPGYARSVCQFNTPSDTAFVRIKLRKNSGAADVVVDAVQLELGATVSSYHELYGNTEKVFMKKAPSGTACTGLPTDPEECSKFAKSCRREDVGCNLYSPTEGGTKIPASVTASDLCPATCVGYDSFKEEPTGFKDGSFPLFLIPKTGKACSASQNGCEEFTNMEKLAAGGEAREYFTDIRYCQKPDSQVGTFYTWEGNDERGYQLRVWTLRKSNLAVAATGSGGSDPTGSVASTSGNPTDAAAPCTSLRYDANGQPVCNDAADPSAVASCGKAGMKLNPDCREFYDVEGNIHYRLYSKTIVSSDSCVDLRLTVNAGGSEGERRASCESHGGLWTRNECHYLALLPESGRCPAAAAGCRAYAGNASRNVRTVFDDGFEGGTTDDWEPPESVPGDTVINSNESITAGGHSLKAVTPTVQKGVFGKIQESGSYQLSFWAKGAGDLTAALTTVGAEPFATVSLSTDWKVYTVGPVVIPGQTAPEDLLTLTNPGAGLARPFFVDNVRLSEIADSVYLIKNSWKTPDECDRTPSGNVAPQYMLGCRTYTDRKNAKVFLKSFDRLCREEVSGCEAFYDTKNSDSPFAQTFRAVCSLPDDFNAPPDADTSVDVCRPTGGALTCGCQVGGKVVCQVVAGFTTCRYDSDDDAGNVLSSVDPVNGHISPDGDTVRIPRDDFAYLIDDQEFHCQDQNLGCTALGKRTLNPDGDVITAWETVHRLNDPKSYSTILCGKEEEFCQEFTRIEDNVQMYFKTPGNHACEFKTGVTISGFNYNGWFKKGTSEPCYPDFLRGGNFYDLWRNSDSLYEGWTGECPQNFSRCKEYIDPLDVSNSYPYGQPYYAIANERLDIKSCEGRVSRTTAPSAAKDASACVLFRQADNVTTPFSAQPSYDKSDADYGALVPAVDSASLTHTAPPPACDPTDTTPESCCGNGVVEKAADNSWKEECDRGPLNGRLGINCDGQCRALNDSNVVIRVKRDRQCAQWLDCRSSETVFNPADGTFTNVCTGYGLCDKFQKVGDSTRCVKFIDNELSGQVLSNVEYAMRNVNWDGLEYSGYSVPNRYPLEELKTIDTDSNRTQANAVLRKPDPRLVYSIGTSACSGKDYGDPCGDPNNLDNVGSCLGPGGALECVYPIDGSAAAGQEGQLKQFQGRLSYPAASCRAYPQETSPFPANVADPGGWDLAASEINGGNPRFIAANPAFAAANVCQRRVVGGVEVGSCECSYQIATYGGTVKKYLSIEDGDVPAGYCEGGQYDGFECDPLSAGLRTRSNLSCCSKVIPPEKGDAVPGGLSVDCEQGGDCKAISKVDHVVGYEGQCLERDFTSPINNKADEFACQTWRPVGVVGGSRDIYNLYKSAGYFTPIDRRYYCFGQENAWSLELSVDTGKNIDDARQPFLKFFKPGRVTNMELSFASGDNDCEDSDRDVGGEWCLFPGLSPQNETFQKNSDGTTRMCPNGSGCGSGFTCQCTLSGLSLADCDNNDQACKASSGKNYQAAPAYNVLGCYEVSDEANAEKASIEWDYVGPAVYRDQLQFIYFVMVQQVSDSVRGITNPNQNTHGNCNDEHDDSLISSNKIDSNRAEAVTHDHILNEDGRWKKNLASQSGDIMMEAFFDSQRRLSRLKLTATDANDEGTFGIEKMGFQFKPGCSNVVRVDQPGEFGLTKAWTDAVNVFSNFLRTTGDNQFTDGAPIDHTSYIQACRPWGAIGGTSRNPTYISGGVEKTNTPWGWVTRHPKQPPTPAPPPNNDPNHEAQVDQCTLTSFLAASEYSSDQNDAKALQKLFRAAFDRYEYQQYGSGDVAVGGELTKSVYLRKTGTAFDLTADVANTIPPRVASVEVGKCDASGNCIAKNLDKITVGNKDAGIITAPGGVFQATVRFYGWASHNAMPVISRTVDWGDSTAVEPPGYGWYRNQKPYCSADISTVGAAMECSGIPGLTCRVKEDCPGGASCVSVGAHFGNSPGACSVGSFQFDHNYTCTVRDLDRLTTDCSFDSRDRATNAPCRENFGGAQSPQWTCVYRPAVQIRDNWNWCNCSGSGCRIPDSGAYGNECNRTAGQGGSARPWTYFDGEVRVQAGDIDNLLFRPGGGSCNMICQLQRIYVGGAGLLSF